jgi:hypothetical protein
VRFYQDGLSNPETVDVVSILGTEVSLTRIFAAIDRIYETCLATPDAQGRAGKLWKDQERWWPSSQAEDIVQLNLRAGLTGAFPTCTVRHEQTSTPGRLDIEIEESDPFDGDRIIRHAVLELKVLRRFSEGGSRVSDNETREWVASGLLQAASYRDNRRALSAALCCFDMREAHSGAECFDHIRERAKQLGVTLRSWLIFNSAGLYREYLESLRQSS